MREPLKTRTGCSTCKQRKKKCDESKPVCANCQRLKLSCQWDSSSRSKASDVGRGDHTIVALHAPSAVPDPLDPADIALLDSETSQGAEPHRSDHNPFFGPEDIAFDAIAEPFASAQKLPVSTTDFAKAFEEHICITGVFLGWETVRQQFDLDPQWDHLIFLDGESAKCGHGPVSRMSFIWSWRTVMKYVSMNESNHLMPIPPWYIPQHGQRDPSHHAIIDYFPWPGVRERLMSQTDKYMNDAWLGEYMMDGFRFVWPYSPSRAVDWNPGDSMLKVSDEFRMRVQNIRSYTLGHDFLERYPEFRGSAAQLEPSVTCYRPVMKKALEEMFWAALRKKYPRKRPVMPARSQQRRSAVGPPVTVDERRRQGGKVQTAAPLKMARVILPAPKKPPCPNPPYGTRADDLPVNVLSFTPGDDTNNPR